MKAFARFLPVICSAFLDKTTFQTYKNSRTLYFIFYKVITMDRRSFFWSVFFMITGFLFVHATSVRAQMVHGWELGARTGLMWQHGTLNINGTARGNALTRERYIADNGWLGGLFVGYNWKEELVTFGLNLALDWNGIDDPHHFHAKDAAGNNFLVNARYERDFFYGVSARVGYRAWESITPFARVGIERSTNRLNLLADGVNNPAIPVRVLDTALSHHKTGYLLGAGIDIPVYNQNTNLRLEYQYHFCGNIDYFINSNYIAGKAQYQPKAHFLTIGLQWGQI